MQSSLFVPGCPVIFPHSTGEHMGGTTKGPSEKGELFAVLERIKGGQVVPHPCAPVQRVEIFIWSLSLSPKPGIPLSPSPLLNPSKPNICRFLMLHCSWEHGREPEISCSNTFLCLHAFENVGGG